MDDIWQQLTAAEQQQHQQGANTNTIIPSILDDISILQTSSSGHVALAVNSCDDDGDIDVHQYDDVSTLPLGHVPGIVIDDDDSELEKFLLDPLLLSVHSSIANAQRSCPREAMGIASLNNLLKLEVTKPIHTLNVPASLCDDDVDNNHYEEVINEVGVSGTAADSTSMMRAPGVASSFHTGESHYFPFRPGGMEHLDVKKRECKSKVTIFNDAQVNQLLEPDSEHTWKCIPPGFSHGLTFDCNGTLTGQCQLDQEAIRVENDRQQTAMVEVLEAAIAGVGVNGDSSDDEEDDRIRIAAVAANAASTKLDEVSDDAMLQEVLDSDSTPSMISNKKPSDSDTKEETKQVWAVMLDSKQEVTNFSEHVPSMAFEYPFELDTFQKLAIIHLERRESVFVAAHTSAGKTVVAEYAIALAKKHMTRAIYTSPIKALSNQKFRDFKNTFDDVGLLTGDVQIRPEASCLVMTTEILRSMLYKGADLIRDIEWVIFDEVHYINDQERGVVWEEVIIMLPVHVNIILLSATVPNTFEFADWVGRTKRKKIYVVSTSKRPVPLEHFLYVGTSGKSKLPQPGQDVYATCGMHRILAKRSDGFVMSGYRAAYDAVNAPSINATRKLVARNQSTGASGRGGSQAKRGGQRTNSHGDYHSGVRTPQTSGGNNFGGFDKTYWQSLIDMLRGRELLPVVAFTFSKKRCEENTYGLCSVDLLTAAEKAQVHIFAEHSLARLKNPDRNLPQVLRIRESLKRGIATHHGGLLPIVKEMVEMLFAKGLVKVLFATETFAMGVNMPARCVVFDSIRKHDGTNFRYLLPGEYIQMAGRAGRRGLDRTGTVIILCKNGQIPEVTDINTMMLGAPMQLSSRFRLTYNMILNVLRVEELRVEDMIKRSFSEFATQRDAPEHQRELKDRECKLKDLPVLDCLSCCQDLEDYYDMSSTYLALGRQMHAVMLSNHNANKLIGVGRVLVINTPRHRNSLASIVCVTSDPRTSDRTFTVVVLVDEDWNPEKAILEETVEAVTVVRTPHGHPSHALAKHIGANDILLVTSSRIRVEGAEAIASGIGRDHHEQATHVRHQLTILVQKSQSLTAFNPVKEMKLNSMDFVDIWQRRQSIEMHLKTLVCSSCPDLFDHYSAMHTRKHLVSRVHHLRTRLSDEALHLLPDYQNRIHVLKNMGYIDDRNTIQLKGRVACEVATADELILSELILENVLSELEPPEIASVLSALVFQQKSDNEPVLTERLQQAKASMISIATRVAEMQQRCGMDLPVDEYLRTLKFGLMEVVYEWAHGMPFSQIVDLTDVLEGTIVRCIMRLDETCRDVRNAARIIGDSTLYQKMEEASVLIKRDIVFAASLYTQ